MAMPAKPSSEPTERSILRSTMTKTMPVAMMPTTLVCTARFHRLRAVRKVPCVKIWKPIQIRKSAPIMPSRRMSRSSDAMTLVRARSAAFVALRRS